MNPTMFEIGVATVMVGVTVALVVWIRRYMAAASERRMMSMLQCAGLDPEIATQGETEAIIKDIRRRCRRCPSEAFCDRWLAGEEKGGNTFCPNARVFDMLTRTAESAG